MTVGRRKFWTLAFWIGILLVIIATVTLISACKSKRGNEILLLLAKSNPQIPPNMELINYSQLSITSLTEDQLSALKGKLFSEVETNDASVTSNSK